MKWNVHEYDMAHQIHVINQCFLFFFFYYYLLNWKWESDSYIINVVTTEELICIIYNSSF